MNFHLRVKRLKLFLVTILLTFILLSMIISLDLLMGTNPKGVILKAMNPYMVMEPAEFIIVLLFILFFILKSVSSYFKNKKKENPSSN